ncbi:MAG: hypothetical protein IPH07_36905 [Deltaproteobacteria bacterium]|nr:hypothetical protein [Deltaproteobacteria bacterium]MBK8713404.1 hypothetical protein [Deltaproteobacteria bacterium]MBP7288029.1 hypothetical protein [Nannocystaceae bacterium]
MRHVPFFALPAVLALGSCTTVPDRDCISERRQTANQLTANVITSNILLANGLLGTSLPAAQLTGGAIEDAVGPEALADDEVRRAVSYAVGCALGPEQSIEIASAGIPLRFDGAIGLAPQWAEDGGVCGEACQGWVSACLIARTNFLGQSREISLLGDHPQLVATEEEADAFDVEEATYFGRLFGPDKTMYACLPDGASGPERTCGDDPSTCAITVLGACSDVCDAAGCRGDDGRVYAERITVNLDERVACE